MSAAQYRKKPVVIEAVLTSELIDAFAHDWAALPVWAAEAYDQGVIVAIAHDHLTIKTLEGDHRANASDMVIRGVKGELYPCRADIFAATYEAVEESA